MDRPKWQRGLDAQDTKPLGGETRWRESCGQTLGTYIISPTVLCPSARVASFLPLSVLCYHPPPSDTSSYDSPTILPRLSRSTSQRVNPNINTLLLFPNSIKKMGMLLSRLLNLPNAVAHVSLSCPSFRSAHARLRLRAATMTMHARSYAPISSKPSISSPLAASSSPRPLHQRTNSSPAFPTSRPLRPFPSINTSISKRGAAAKPVKIIEPPKNFRGEWVLNLTQAEFGRQD